MGPSLPRYCSLRKLHFYSSPLHGLMGFFLSSNVAGQWSPVFMQPLPEEEIVIRDDQDPRVSDAKVLYKEMI